MSLVGRGRSAIYLSPWSRLVEELYLLLAALGRKVMDNFNPPFLFLRYSLTNMQYFILIIFTVLILFDLIEYREPFVSQVQFVQWLWTDLASVYSIRLIDVCVNSRYCALGFRGQITPIDLVFRVIFSGKIRPQVFPIWQILILGFRAGFGCVAAMASTA